MNKWYLSGGANTDVAVSTRVRFARNLTGFPFPGRMSSSQREQVNGLVREAAMHLTGEFAGVFHYAEMKELSDLESKIYQIAATDAKWFAKYVTENNLDDKYKNIMLQISAKEHENN